MDAARTGFLKADYIVNKSYLVTLEDCDIAPLPQQARAARPSDSVCFFPIRKLVYDPEESTLQRLANVYACAAVAGLNVAMLIRSEAGAGVRICLGVCDPDGDRISAYSKARILCQSFMGNFPGSRMGAGEACMDADEIDHLLDGCYAGKNIAVAAVSGVASLRGSQEQDRNERFYQGIEKVIDTMGDRDYSLLILANSEDKRSLQGIQRELEALYSSLSPLSKYTLSFSQSQGDSVTRTLSNAVTDALTESRSESLNIGKNRSTSEGTNTFASRNIGLGVNFGLWKQGPGISPNAGFAKGEGTFTSDMTGDSENQGQTSARTQAHTTSHTASDGTTVTHTDSYSTQATYENKEIADMLASIDLQIKRLKQGMSLGMFAVSAYFCAPTLMEARMGASAYRATISGDNSYVERDCVNTWTGDRAALISQYLRQCRHPEFALQALGDETTVTAATLATAPELALSMGLPRKSVNGVPVQNGVAFGRNVLRLNGQGGQAEGLKAGNIYHLGITEGEEVKLDLDSLTMHTFVTGTTGSGKSNAVYGMLEGIRELRREVRFLVVEPAKGEYKTVFGSRENVYVYGINPKQTPLLRINPFRFRPEVHILEHLDRLVGIFNVCWPMEAAMPAVLKQALERAYVAAGWDLQSSTNPLSEELFPMFEDVIQAVEDIMEESSYSDEGKGNYIGALCTRLRELTTGLNGMMFTPNDLTDRELFERNVIVDLSRLGSPETKALIMGLIVIRLQEYRQSTQDSLHTGLKHITVLEEAHHLLKRTSTEQSVESANLTGKAVEMLTNAFAEMRSAGEAFIIADQAPGMMDMSVIRNTNTKVVLRLPSQTDGELVGKAMGLTDTQIAELSRLPTGVAAIYQNDWLQAALTRIPYYPVEEGFYHYDHPDARIATVNGSDEANLLDAIMRKDGVERLLDAMPDSRVDSIARLRVPTRVKLRLIEYAVHEGASRLEKLGRLAFEFFNMRQATLNARSDSLEEWEEDVLAMLEPSVESYDRWDQETLLLVLCSEYARRMREFEPVYLSLVKHIL